MRDRFRIVYEKLDQEGRQATAASVERIEIVNDELEEIAELRRLSAALAEPDSQSYTVS